MSGLLTRGILSRRLTRGVLIAVVIFAAAQLIRPGTANPATDPGLAIQAQPGAGELGSVLNRSCGACHSNDSEWPGYTKVAPLSWLTAYAAASGRKVVNFSEWASYSPEAQRKLLAESCNAVSEGRMPGGYYVALRSEARLSKADVQTICAAAR